MARLAGGERRIACMTPLAKSPAHRRTLGRIRLGIEMRPKVDPLRAPQRRKIVAENRISRPNVVHVDVVHGKDQVVAAERDHAPPIRPEFVEAILALEEARRDDRNVESRLGDRPLDLVGPIRAKGIAVTSCQRVTASATVASRSRCRRSPATGSNARRSAARPDARSSRSRWDRASISPRTPEMRRGVGADSATRENARTPKGNKPVFVQAFKPGDASPGPPPPA